MKHLILFATLALISCDPRSSGPRFENTDTSAGRAYLGAALGSTITTYTVEKDGTVNLKLSGGRTLSFHAGKYTEKVKLTTP